MFRKRGWQEKFSYGWPQTCFLIDFPHIFSFFIKFLLLFFCILVFFACLFVFLKLEIYILIHIRPTMWASDKKKIHLADFRNQDYLFWPNFISVFSEAVTSLEMKKGVLKNFPNFTWKHQFWCLFFNKVAGLRKFLKIYFL